MDFDLLKPSKRNLELPGDVASFKAGCVFVPDCEHYQQIWRIFFYLGQHVVVAFYANGVA